MLLQMNIIDKPINFFGQKYTDISVFGYIFKFPLALSMVIAFEIWRYFPLSFLFILARMQSLPEDVFDAAKIDGASPFQQFYYISLPFLIGIISILFLLRFIWTFNKFDDSESLLAEFEKNSSIFLLSSLLSAIIFLGFTFEILG